MALFGGTKEAVARIRVKYDGKDAEKGARSLSKAFGGAKAKFALTTAALAGLTVALVKAKQAMDFAVKSAISFEAAGSRLKAILKPTTKEFEALEKQAEKLGQTTVFTASQVMESFTEMGKLGFETNEILAAGNEVLSLAALAQVDMATAATTTVQTLNQFQLAAEESGRVVDIIAKSFTTSALDITKFSEAMKFVGPIAGTTGEEIEDVTGALAVLADNAIDASLAGTAMRRILLELANSNSKASKLIASTGKETNTLADKMRVLRDMNIDATKATDLFGLRATTAAQVLVKNADAVDKLADEFRNANGAAKEMADTMLDNVEGASVRLKSAQEALALSIKEFTLPAMRAWKEFLIDINLGIKDVIEGGEKLRKQQAKESDETIQEINKQKEIIGAWEEAIEEANDEWVKSPLSGREIKLTSAENILNNLTKKFKNLTQAAKESNDAIGGKQPGKTTGGFVGQTEEQKKAAEKELKERQKQEESFADEILRRKKEANDKSIEEERRKNEELKAQEQFHEDEIFRMKQEANEESNRLLREQAKEEIRIAKEVEEKKEEFAQNTVSAVSSINNTLMAISDARTRRELDNLDKRGLSEKQLELEREKILKKSQKKRRAFARVQQGVAVAEATMNAFKAGAGAAADTPGGPIIRGIASGLAIAQGLVTVGLIQAQNFQTGRIGEKSRTRNVDNIPALLGRGETVISAPQSAANEDLLRAIQNNTANTAQGVAQTGGHTTINIVGASTEQVLNVITQSERTNSTGLII
jgi:TP901 family phage tail tape measure protein